jgi:sensor histidine kinase YesM
MFIPGMRNQTGRTAYRFSSKSLASVSVWRGLVWVVLFDVGIAALVSTLLHSLFLDSFLISQFFGLSIYASFVVFDRFSEIRLATFWIPLLVGVLLGTLLQIMVWILPHHASLAEVWAVARASLEGFTQGMLIALFFSVIILYFLITRSREIHDSHALQAARIKNLAHEKHMAETRLHLLQAQIEPHFLFNTLSHVQSLVDTDPPQGKKMLASLTRYLRSSLKRSRERDATLRQEIELIRDYLDIYKVRMGKRLTYTIDIPEDCLAQRFMPMLLQPLVENAIQHGLEPAPAGGEIRLRAAHRDGVLQLQVMDNGLGLRHDTESGFGLVNIRERLRSLYGDAARLRIEALAPTGVRAIIEVPYDSH